MPSLLAATLVAIFALFTAMPARADAALSSPETVYLDSYRAATTGSTDTVQTGETLAPGQYYVATVGGTYSAFLSGLMSKDSIHPLVLCGTTEALATTPSPGRPESAVGQDAEVVFARPWESSCPIALPMAQSSFQIDAGSGFTHLAAAGGPYTTPRADHTYAYLLHGQGAPAAFRMLDTYTRDNFGVLTITVRPATASDCAGDADCLASLRSLSPAAPAAAAASPSLTLAARSCTSRRRVTIRVVSHRKDPVVRASARANGKPLKVVVKRIGGARRLTSVLDMRGLPLGKMTLKLTARTRAGRILTGSRTYRTCTVRKPGGRPPL